MGEFEMPLLEVIQYDYEAGDGLYGERGDYFEYKRQRFESIHQAERMLDGIPIFGEDEYASRILMGAAIFVDGQLHRGRGYVMEYTHPHKEECG